MISSGECYNIPNRKNDFKFLRSMEYFIMCSFLRLDCERIELNFKTTIISNCRSHLILYQSIPNSILSKTRFGML
jgi:hypothetical protein